jgi:hypothetical protein
MISVVKRHPLVSFFVLAYGLSWGNLILSRARPNVPFLFLMVQLFAAVIVASITCGRGGLKDMLCRCLRWHVGLEWYAAALFIPVVIALTAIFLMVLFGGDTSPTEQINLGQIN